MPLGFAMGGALAVAVVSGILADSYLNKEVLENRVACITFGQPLMADCIQQEFVEREGYQLRYAFVQQEAAMKPDDETGAAVRICILYWMSMFCTLFIHSFIPQWMNE